MKKSALWQKVETRYVALQARERKLVAGCTLAVILLGGYSLLVAPALIQRKSLSATVSQQQSELNNMQAQITALRGQMKDPDGPNRSALGEARTQISKIEEDLHAFDHILVNPATMPKLLQNLLSKYRGLTIVSLKTLPVTPLVTPPKEPPKEGAGNIAQPAAPKPEANPLAAGGMYRHAMEITISGSYLDLLAYAEELQRISPRPLWSAMGLKVVEYPRSELTLTLYTLSLDLPWLAV